MTLNNILRWPTFFALFLSAVGTSLAAEYPTRPIRLVVSYPTGGDTDAAARIIAEKLSIRFGQPVIVDNRPGAGGAIGNAQVARSDPDGYTLLFSPSALPVLQHVIKVTGSVSYDPVKDFTPISLVGEIPLVMVTASSTGINSVADVIVQARSGKSMTYGSAGNGSPMHFAGEMFNHAAGISVPHVPYKGVGPLVNDLLGGHVTIGYATPGSVAGHISSGKLVGLATLTKQRLPLEGVAKLPTLVELGYKDVEIKAWLGVFGPSKLPKDISMDLNRQVNEVLKMPEVKQRLAVLGVVPLGGAPSELLRQVQQDDARFGSLAKQFSIQAQ